MSSSSSICVYDVVTEEDAAVILHYKDRLRTGSLVNVCGHVTAVSEVFRVKKDHLFLVQLQNIFIVVKQEKFLHWQDFITPQQEFVFSNLHPTTLHKGITVPTRVFVPWTGGELHAVDQVEISTISIQAWLTKNTSPGHKAEHDDKKTFNLQAKEDRTRLVSYQGMVTSTENSRYGVYELDKKIRLYVSAVPARHKFSFMKVGTRVVVYNVHREEFTQEHRIHLYCCVKSCVKVVEECTLSPSSQKKVRTFSPYNPVVQLIGKCGLDGLEICNLLDMMERMNNKAMAKGLEQVENVVSLIVSSFCSWLQQHPRNLVGEFLAVPHCCHLIVHKTSSDRIPVIKEIGRLLEEAHGAAQDLSHVKNKYTHRNLTACELNRQLYWSYLPQVIEKNTQQVLIGWFEFSSITGHLELSDGTRKISVVCPSLEHICDQTCLHFSVGKPLTCPKVHPGLNGCLVGVGKCEVITERFLNTDMPDCEHIDSRHILQSQYVVYLQMCLTDCILLARDESRENSEPPKKLQKVSSDDGVIGTSDCVVVNRPGDCGSQESGGSFQLVFITHIDSLMVKSSSTRKSLGFCALGYFIGDPTDIVPKRDLCQSKEANQPGVGCKTSTGHDQTPVDDELIIVDSNCRAIPVVLVFQGKSVRWYESLQTGSFYRLVCKGDKSVFNAKEFYGTRLKAAVDVSNARMCFEVLDDLHINRVVSASVKGLSEATKQRLEPAPLDLIVEILSDSFSGTVVSFCAEILSRKHLDSNLPATNKIGTRKEELEKINKTLGISTLNGKTVCLEVIDSERNSILVYMNLENMSYPLGLLAGARVLFSRLERRVSYSGTVYCQYTAVSTVSVCQLFTSASSSLSAAETTTDHGEVVQVNTQLPVQYLAELYHGLVSSVGSFQLICHICTFMKLSLRVVCAGCGTRFTHSGCISAHCSSNKSTCLAKASVLVDDGSSVAIVSFNKADLVRRVLCLSQEQWQDLQDMVQDQEEVFIHQFIGYFRADSPVESFLMLLCDSSHVKRRINMCVRPARASMHIRPTTFNINNFTKEEFVYKKITTGDETFETRCHPYLQLECLDIQEESLEQEIFHKLST